MKNLFIILLFLATTACGQGTEPARVSVNSAPVTQGEVLETMDVESYTYIRLGTGDGEIWLATSPVDVEKGDRVKFTGGVPMSDFHSTSLDRTFEQISFVGVVERLDPGTAMNIEPAATSVDASDPHAGLGIPSPATEKATDTDVPAISVSIAELFANPGQFAGQRVTLRGKVVKVNANIMGKNWLTLQDESGVAPGNQLTVTSLQTAAAGDDLVLTGVVRTDLDFGYGYEYELLLEDAVFE